MSDNAIIAWHCYKKQEDTLFSSLQAVVENYISNKFNNDTCFKIVYFEMTAFKKL